MVRLALRYDLAFYCLEKDLDHDQVVQVYHDVQKVVVFCKEEVACPNQEMAVFCRMELDRYIQKQVYCTFHCKVSYLDMGQAVWNDIREILVFYHHTRGNLENQDGLQILEIQVCVPQFPIWEATVVDECQRSGHLNVALRQILVVAFLLLERENGNLY